MKCYWKLKLFPHHLYVAQCSGYASHLIFGPGGTTTLSAFPGSSVLGVLWLMGLIAPGLHHQPLVPGKYFLNGSVSAFRPGRQRHFFQTPVGVSDISKTRWIFSPH